MTTKRSLHDEIKGSKSTLTDSGQSGKSRALPALSAPTQVLEHRCDCMTDGLMKHEGVVSINAVPLHPSTCPDRNVQILLHVPCISFTFH